MNLFFYMLFVFDAAIDYLINSLMADPNPKRAKMDNPDGRSSSTNPEGRKNPPKRAIINPSTQNFDLIRNMRGFVDHTHFIRSFLLKKEPKLAIFAPRRFGKSSQLSMVDKFLRIDVDKRTGEISSSVNGPAKGRKNYEVFDGTRIITDDIHMDLVEDHLGKHPVIHLDFKAAFIDSVKKARQHCRLVVHRAYQQHPYLMASTKLVSGDEEENAECQNICGQWCDDRQYKKQDLDGCLENLTKYLHNHFGAKVYILVDEFDAVNASALLTLCRKSDDDTVKILQDICDTLTDILGPVTKGDNPHVAGALITGVSYVVGLGYSSLLNNFTTMKFLDGTKILPTDQDFVPFYGATKEQVRNLIQKFVRDKELLDFEGKEEFFNDNNELDVDKIMADVQSRYNGYSDKNGTRIFCLWSVLQYLQTGVARNYWNQTSGLADLFKILKCGKVADEIMKLMRCEIIEFKRYDKIMIKDIVQLHDLMAVKNKDKVNPEVVFNFLIDQGYLGYPEGGAQDEKFKLPSAEIRAALSGMISDIVRSWTISTTSCTRLIDDISLSLMKEEKLLHKKMLCVYRELSEILTPLEQKNRALVDESRMLLFIMYKTLNDANSFELDVDLRIEDAEGGSVTLDRPNFLLMHKNDKKCSILGELRYKDSTKDEYTTSLYALQEARGNVATKNGKTKKYMNLLKKLGREALVIGLSMDSDFKVSLSCSLNMEEKIFFMSEREDTLHPDLYKTHNPVSLLKEEDEAMKKMIEGALIVSVSRLTSVKFKKP